MLDERTTCLCDGSGTEAVVDLAVVVLVAAVEASLVRVAQIAPLQVNMHFAQSEIKDIINSAWHFFQLKIFTYFIAKFYFDKSVS